MVLLAYALMVLRVDEQCPVAEVLYAVVDHVGLGDDLVEKAALTQWLMGELDLACDLPGLQAV